MEPLLIIAAIIVAVLFSLIALLEYKAYTNFVEKSDALEALAAALQESWKQTISITSGIITQQSKQQLASAEAAAKLEAVNLQVQALDMIVAAYGDVLNTKALSTGLLKDLVNRIGEKEDSNGEIPGETSV